MRRLAQKQEDWRSHRGAHREICQRRKRWSAWLRSLAASPPKDRRDSRDTIAPRKAAPTDLSFGARLLLKRRFNYHLFATRGDTNAAAACTNEKSTSRSQLAVDLHAHNLQDSTRKRLPKKAAAKLNAAQRDERRSLCIAFFFFSKPSIP